MRGKIQINITKGVLRLASVFPHLRVITPFPLEVVVQAETPEFSLLTFFAFLCGNQLQASCLGPRQKAARQL